MSLLTRTYNLLSHRMPLVRSPALLGSVRGKAVAHGDGKKPNENWDEYEQRYIGLFKDPNLDHWWMRKRLQDLYGEDIVPDPKLSAEVLRACKRLNDFGLAVRFLEACRYKCGPKVNSIWPWYMQELQPVMNELGIPTLEELGYHKPELACPSVDDL